MENKNIKLDLSTYAQDLDLVVRTRYIQKISVIGIDPYQSQFNKLDLDSQLDSKCLPPIDALNVVSFLVLETSFYTKKQFNNFKSLDAYNQVVSGFVSSVKGIIICDQFLVVGKVLHSQRIREKQLKCWAITTKDGTVLSAHCNCMAGLGECCSHIASVLFYTELKNRLHGNLSCTDIKCSWIIPSGIKEASFSRTCDIVFKSVDKLKKDIEDSADIACSDSVKSPKCLGLPLTEDISPTLAEKDNLYEALSKCKHKPVILSLFKKYASAYVSPSRNVCTVTDLYDETLFRV